MQRSNLIASLLGAALLLPGCEPVPENVIPDGMREALEGLDQPIVGGSTTTGWDEVVWLYMGGGVCTGTLISQDVVLTASHCIDGVWGTVEAYWGDDIVNQGYTQKRTSTDYHMHPNYNDNTMVADIAVVVLSSNGPGGTIPINTDAASNSWLGNANPLTFVGFGVTAAYLDNSGTKREVDIAVDNWDYSLLYYYDSQHQTCFGDSGGPAFTDHTGGWRVAAVTSFGDQDCNQMGASTRTDTYASWIEGYTGTTPTDDDDDASSDDDDASTDDDDASTDDDDAQSDDDAQTDDDDYEPPHEDLPEPRTNYDYDQMQGCSCSDHAPGRGSAAVLALAALLMLAIRRR